MDPSDEFFILETNLNSIDGYAPTTFNLNKEVTTLGRGSQGYPVDVYISARKDSKEIISRRHAEIIRTPHRSIIIRDIGALNGIFVNDKRISEHTLTHGDTVQFGGIANVPIGTSLKVSDICLRYRFECKMKPPSSKSISASISSTSTTLHNGNTGKTLSSKENGSRSKDRVNKNTITTTYHMNPLTTPLPATDGNKVCFEKRSNATSNIGVVVTKEAEEEVSELRKELERVRAELAQSRSEVEEIHIKELKRVRQSVSSPPNDDVSHNNNNNNNMIKKQKISPTISTTTTTTINNATTINTINPSTDGHKLSLTKHNRNNHSTASNDNVNGTITGATYPLSNSSKNTSTTPPTTSTTISTPGVSVSIANSNSQCTIDVSALRSHLNCPLCGFTLLDAAVLRCSHAFCTLCIVKHTRDTERREGMGDGRGSSSGSSSRRRSIPSSPAPQAIGMVSAPSPPCPVCHHDDSVSSDNNNRKPTSVCMNDNNNNNNNKISAVGMSSTGPPYFRSEHLDSVVWLLLEASGDRELQSFQNREKEHRKLLRQYGIDPDAPVGCRSSPLTGHNTAERRTHHAGDGSSLSLSSSPPRCEYCGGAQHEDPEAPCPHDSHSHSRSRGDSVCTEEDCDGEDDDDEDEDDDSESDI